MNVRSLLRRSFATAAAAGFVLIGAMGAASAALQAEVIANGTSGTLANGVSWQSTTAYEGTVSYVSQNPNIFNPTSTLTLSGSPTAVEFDIAGLSPVGTNFPNPECVILPAGAVPLYVSAHHSFNAAQNQICGSGPQGNTMSERSRFVVNNPGNSVTWTSNSDPYYPQGDSVRQHIVDVTVTADVEDVPVVSLPVLGAGAALAGTAFVPGLVKRARKTQQEA